MEPSLVIEIALLDTRHKGKLLFSQTLVKIKNHPLEGDFKH